MTNNFLYKSRLSVNKGFTLVELLVVIVIIGIVSSVAMLTIHINHNKQLEALAQHIAHLITLAEEEALLRPVVMGLAFTPKTFQFYQYDENTHSWKNLTNKVFLPQNVPADTQIKLIINNKVIPADGKPHLIISTNGDIPAFTIEIANSEGKSFYQVIGSDAGDIHVK